MSQGMPIDAERSAPEGDISLGRELRRAREVRGFTIQQIQQETKINERYLHALENDRLDLLPGQPYTANFVRAVARCIGADEEELIDYLNYHLRMQQPERAQESRQGRERPRGGIAAVVAIGAVLLIVALGIALRSGGDDGEKASAPKGRDRAARASAPEATAPGTAVVPAAGLATAGTDGSPAEAASAPAAPVKVPPPILAGMTSAAPAPPQPTAASAPAATAPAAASATAPAGPSGDEGPAPTVRLVFNKKSWIEAEQQGDAKPLLGIKDPGLELTWTLDRPLSLELSNAGGVEMFIDGQPAKPLGAQGETRRLTLDKRNWKSFLK